MNRVKQVVAMGVLLLGVMREGRGAGPGATAPVPLDHWLSQSAIWTDGAEAFMDESGPIGFEYMSARDVARSVHTNLMFLSNRVWEAQAFFATGRVVRVELLLFSRGDTGDRDEEDFRRMVKGAGDSLSRWAGTKGSGLPESVERGTRHVQGRAWRKPPSRAELEWAYSTSVRSEGGSVPFRAEYVRVRLMPAGTEGGAPPPPTMGNSTVPSAASLKKRVRHADSGDLWIGDIPMVDQGEKGYCAAATAERVLRYFGRPIDQHQVAQIADTARDKGTSLDGMLGALRAIGQRCQLDVRPIQEFDWTEVVRLLKDYNRVATAKRKPQIEFGQTIELGEVYGAMEPGLLRQARARDAQGIARFRQQIMQYTAAGVPLVWGVMVGLYPETPPLRVRGAFGHIRLIVGLNAKTDEILYSDSWGSGHECKRMPISDAWAMTVSLHVVKSRDVR